MQENIYKLTKSEENKIIIDKLKKYIDSNPVLDEMTRNLFHKKLLIEKRFG